MKRAVAIATSVTLVTVAALVAGGLRVVASPHEARRAAPRVAGVVLLCVDTLRADALDLDAVPPDGALPFMSMPALAQFAQEGVTFTDAIAPSSWTGPSLASMLTGVVALRHGVGDPSGVMRIPAGVPTLASTLRAAGWSTWASTGGGWAGAAAGADLGFGRFREDFDAKPPSETITQWRRDVGADSHATATRPFFLMLHTYAAHDPYGDRSAAVAGRCGDDPAVDAVRLARSMTDASEGAFADLRREFVRLRMTDPCARRGLDSALGRTASAACWQRCVAWLDGGWREDPDDRRLVAQLHDAYLDNLHSVDDRVGQTLEALAASMPKATWDRVAVVVTSDHGEAFGEHGVVYHGSRLSEELVRVPLLVKAPGLAAGARVDSTCGVVDVMPTILELAGVAAPERLDGQSLVPLVPPLERSARDAGRRRGRCVESFVRPLVEIAPQAPPSLRRVAVRNDGVAWIAAFDPATSTWIEEQWFDRTSDPKEQHPLAATPAHAASDADDASLADAVRSARERVEHRYGATTDATVATASAR